MPPVNIARIIALPPENWTEQEKWVWECARKGDVADFNLHPNGGGALSPEDKDWADLKAGYRILRSNFLATILAEEPFSKAIHRNGIQIIGGWFKEPVNLINLPVSNTLNLRCCLFEREADFTGFQSSSVLSFCGSRVKKSLNLAGLNISSGLYLRDNATFDGDINLDFARIGTALEMSGSVFRGKVGMNGGAVNGKVTFDQSTLYAEIDFRSATIEALSMQGGKFKQKVDLGGIKVVHSIYLRDGAIFERELDLRSASIGGQLDMTASTFKGAVVMNGIKVTGPVFMRGAPGTQIGYRTVHGMKVAGPKPNYPAYFYGEVDLTSADIGNQLSMSAAIYERRVNLNGIKVNGSLFMDEGIYKNDVILVSASIGGQLVMVSSIFEQRINMNGIKVGDQVAIINIPHPAKEVSCVFAKIGGNLDISNSYFCAFDLTGSVIAGELSLSTGQHQATSWTGVDAKQPKFILRNVSINSLQDREEAWLNNNGEPINLEMTGFVYKYLGGLKDSINISIADRPAKWFIEWLGQQKNMAPQPYEQLAKVLNESGYKEKANEILFAGKERQRINTPWGLERIKLELEYRLVGYGFRFRYAFCWSVLLFIVGLLCCLYGVIGDASFIDAAIFSASRILPVLNLGVETTFHLEPWARMYFFIHGVIGYIFSIFIGAGVVGFMKKLR